MFDSRVAVLAFCVLVTLTGLALNTWILVINFKEWKKGVRLQHCDKIHITMATVNILLQCLITTSLCDVWHPVYDQVFINLFSISLLFLVFFSFWLNTWLCMYYVTSIANFHHRTFIWLKSHIVTMLSKLILVSAVGSFAISLPSIWNIYRETQEANMNLTISSTATIPISVNSSYRLTASSLGCFLPFTLSTLCIGHTLTSLLRHIWRVKHNDSGFSRPSLQAHVRAVGTMVLLQMLYASFHLAQTLCFIASYTTEDPLSMLSWFIILFFPTAESVILIQANAKLRKVFQDKFWEGLDLAKGCLTLNM